MMPTAARRASDSCGVKASSGARISVSCPRARHLPSGSAGSARPARTRRKSKGQVGDQEFETLEKPAVAQDVYVVEDQDVSATHWRPRR